MELLYDAGCFPAQAIIARDRTSVALEVQARACEYGHLFGYSQLRTQLLEHMPALDEAHYSRNVATADAIDMSTEPAAQVRNHGCCVDDNVSQAETGPQAHHFTMMRQVLQSSCPCLLLLFVPDWPQY